MTALYRRAAGLLARPSGARLLLGRRFARHDMRRLDDRVIDRLLGVPQECAPGHRDAAAGASPVGPDGLSELGSSRGPPRSSERRRRDGARPAPPGDAIRVLEGPVEQPRYLMLMVMATFVVIL